MDEIYYVCLYVCIPLPPHLSPATELSFVWREMQALAGEVGNLS